MRGGAVGGGEEVTGEVLRMGWVDWRWCCRGWLGGRHVRGVDIDGGDFILLDEVGSSVLWDGEGG